MSGSIQYRSKSRDFYVQWYDRATKKTYKIYRYYGEKIRSKQVANKVLSQMQTDYDKGIFRIEKFLNEQWTDTIPYMLDWLEAVKCELSPATYKDYKNSIKNHLEPFFKTHQFQLHEIEYDVLRKFMTSIKREGKGKANVMYCLHACLTYAWRSGRISVMPPFPEKKHYHIQEPVIQWLPEERQMAIINAIPEKHRPIFLFLKYHLRRPSEAMALKKQDYDKDQDIFIVRRSLSNGQEMERTKTGAIHFIPCHSDFKPWLEFAMKQNPFSPYIFTNPLARSKGKRYGHDAMAEIWKAACKTVGEDIPLYSGLKHSSCSQYINEKGLSMSELQVITDHARLDSVKKYAKMEVARKKELMEKQKVIENGVALGYKKQK